MLLSLMMILFMVMASCRYGLYCRRFGVIGVHLQNEMALQTQTIRVFETSPIQCTYTQWCLPKTRPTLTLNHHGFLKISYSFFQFYRIFVIINNVWFSMIKQNARELPSRNLSKVYLKLTKLTPLKPALIEKLLVAQIINKFLEFYGTWRFIIVFTRAVYLLYLKYIVNYNCQITIREKLKNYLVRLVVIKTL
jgi:hypothetical protein